MATARRLLAAAISCAAVAAFAPSAVAAPLGGPANDLFANAASLGLGEMVQSSTIGAGLEIDEPEGCLPSAVPSGFPISYVGQLSAPGSVWYRVAVTAGAPVALTMPFTSTEAVFEIKAYVRQGESLVPVACEEDSFQLASDGDVYIRVAGGNGLFRMGLIRSGGAPDVRPYEDVDAEHAREIVLPLEEQRVLDYAPLTNADRAIRCGHMTPGGRPFCAGTGLSVVPSHAWYRWTADRDGLVVVRARYDGREPTIEVFVDNGNDLVPISDSVQPFPSPENDGGHATWATFLAELGTEYVVHVTSSREYCCFPTDVRMAYAPSLSLQPTINDVDVSRGQISYTVRALGQVGSVTSWLTSAVHVEVVIRPTGIVSPIVYRTRFDLGHSRRFATTYPATCTGTYEIAVTFEPTTHVELNPDDDHVSRTIVVDDLPTVPGCFPGSGIPTPA